MFFCSDEVYKKEIGLMKLKDTNKVERESGITLKDESGMRKNSGVQIKNDKKSSFLNKDKIQSFLEKNNSLRDHKFSNPKLSNAVPHLELKPIPGDQISALPENLLNSILGTNLRYIL